MSTSEFFISAWDWKPSVVIGCAALTGMYAWAVRFRFSRKAAAWLAGVLLIFLALVSPLDELADKYLFSVHMAKHILFVLVVPALLLIGLPAAPVERVLRYRPAAAAEQFLGTPAIAWTAGIGAMAFWHIPVLFNAALSNEALHIFEHLSLLIGGTIFWWPILSPLAGVPIETGAARRRLSVHIVSRLHQPRRADYLCAAHCFTPRTLSLSTLYRHSARNSRPLGHFAGDGSTDRRTVDVGAGLSGVSDRDHGDVCALVRRRTEEPVMEATRGGAMDLDRIHSNRRCLRAGKGRCPNTCRALLTGRRSWLWL